MQKIKQNNTNKYVRMKLKLITNFINNNIYERKTNIKT